MKKRLFATILILAMLIGTATIATANAPATTYGSIEFKEGQIIINPPPDDDCLCCEDCHPDNYDNGDCDCDWTDPDDKIPGDECPCDCDCDDKDPYDDFWLINRVRQNLYFGIHELTVFGRFDSANIFHENATIATNGEDTTRIGEYTGVEIINQTPETAVISVSIGPFMITPATGPAFETLQGFDLFLMPSAIALSGTQDANQYAQFGGLGNVLENGGGSVEILRVARGREVRAAWSGLLDVEAGTNDPGFAQANLTWTSMNVPGPVVP